MNNIIANYFNTTPALARTLIASLFIISGVKGLVWGFSGFKNMIASKLIPFAGIVALAVLLFKIIAGFSVMFKGTTNSKLAIQALIAFMIIATVLYHNALTNPGELMNALRNLAVIGGLLLLLPPTRIF